MKSTGIDFFTFYATTGAVKCNHQLVVATTGAFTLTSVKHAVLSFAVARKIYVFFADGIINSSDVYAQLSSGTRDILSLPSLHTRRPLWDDVHGRF